VSYRHLRACFSVLVIGTAALVGCGGDGEGQSAAATGSSTSSGTGAGGNGTGGAGGAGGAGGGGTGGAAASKAAPGGSLVSAGHVIASPKYRMVFTVGQSSPVQTRISSPSYTLRGGLIGATGDTK
jgi:hypothetical protein